jgi:hypothetical protein
LGQFPTGWLLMFVVFSISGRLPASPCAADSDRRIERLFRDACQADPTRPLPIPGEYHAIA